ncbi:MAG: hypothetical protein V3T21_06615 [Candidatus Margulisiibacteriota bacterium]
MSNNQNRNWKFGFGIYFVILVWSFVIMLAGGCAKTVTQIVTYGDQMAVEVTLRGNPDNDANRYFLVVSNNANYKIPLPPPDLIEDAPEFIEPGDTPTTGSPEAYYTNFYSTWSGYIILEPSGFFLVRGPFVIDQTPTPEVLSNLGEVSTKINFSFRLGRIFDTVPDNIYFDFVTVPWPDGEAKIPSDHLPTTNNYISKISGSIAAITDNEDSGLEASLDILGCRVEIE